MSLGAGGAAAGASNAHHWRRAATRARTLRTLVRDTQRALRDVCDILHTDPEISPAVQELGSLSSRSSALVILGTSGAARARLLHCLLGRRLLPTPLPRGCRWLRIQYGSSTQAQLTLGNSEFELVDELQCNKRAWDTLPVEDLIRQDPSDLTTVLEIELNNAFLKDGFKILLPPDIEEPPGKENYASLKQTHSELYTKRDLILRNFNCVYLYAIDKIGRNVFSENVVVDSMVTSRSEEDFWTTFNLYFMTRAGGEEAGDGGVEREEVGRTGGQGWSGGEGREPAVFSSENCLDLHQVKDLNSNSQIFFVLFSDSVDVGAEENGREGFGSEATESTEDSVYSTEELPESDQGLRAAPECPGRRTGSNRMHEQQVSFMNEMLELWQLMGSLPQKHYVKSQWAIVDDCEVLRTVDHKVAPCACTLAGGRTGGSCAHHRARDENVRARSVLLTQVVKFATECLHSYLLEYSTKLSEMHVKLLQQFILASFDMARELQVVPKKIQYVARREQQLYETINEKFSEGDKKQELVQIMEEVLREMRSEINSMDWSVDDLPCHQDHRFICNSVFYSSTRSSLEQVSLHLSPTCQPTSQPTSQPASPPEQTPSDGEEAASYDSYNFDDYEIIHSNDESLTVSECYSRLRAPADDSSSATSQVGAIRVENESELWSLSSAARAHAWARKGPSADTCSNSVNISVKQASLDVQQTVLSKLSRKISLKLVKFVDCLKDTYFGTLQRCLESLEGSCRQELGGRPASEAMRQLLSVARQVDLRPCAGFSLLRSLVDSLRRLFHRLRLSGGDAEEACCVLSPLWRRRAALQAAHSLAPHRLARIISTQILERLSVAHDKYQSALAALEAALADRLHHTEDVKLAIRKKYAPAFARLCLESTSLCDVLVHGTPELAREIGRGQYGVVYAVRGAWAGHRPCAAKSVLPADERHYHELAMEFFYTRSIPAHPRIVRLYGSIVQRHGSGGGGGNGPSVLLVSARLARDLHAAVRAGLSFSKRMRISCDIVEGIRYLHSLGLVHRDIKMKNVLLDAEDRASLSDLGFCAAEALISGSVVGTPVHMAPELLAGGYDAAVDVYAFGILFWYVCAGNIKLPSAFEIFQNKEQLWSKVKRGLRPERLPHFTDECWEVMEACWASEPSQRALLGDIQPRLEAILERALREDQGSTPEPPPERADYDVSDDDSLDMTGIDRNGI